MQAVAALALTIGVCPYDMLADHRIVGLEARPSPFDVYLPANHGGWGGPLQGQLSSGAKATRASEGSIPFRP